MSYKIVKIIENEQIFLIAVPHLWEKSNILNWPPNNKSVVEKLRRNGNSAPQPDWIQIACIVKKKNIDKFIDALKIEREYCELTDTDGEEMFNSICMKTKIRRMPTVDPTFCDYNESIQELNIIDTKNIFVDSEQYPDPENVKKETCNIFQEDDNFSYPCVVPENEAIITFNHIEKIPDIERRLDAMECGLVKQSAKIDKCLNILQNIAEKLLASKETISENKEEYNKFNFPLSTVEDLNNFDKALLDLEYKKQMLTKFKPIGGTSGQENGRLVAYKLIDALIERDVLQNFTWTGVSKNCEKLNFSALKDTNIFFAELVRFADNRFSQIENEHFFKNAILKHSISRAKPRKSSRQSTPRTSTKRHKCPSYNECRSGDNFECTNMTVEKKLQNVEEIEEHPK